MSIAYYNGEFCEFMDVRIPLSDRCVFFGDGIYDAAVGLGDSIYLEDEHIDRFFNNAERMNINLSFSKNELSGILKDVIRRNGFEEYFIYFQLSRTLPERLHAYTDASSSSLLVTLKPHILPDSEKCIKLITAEDIRYYMCDVKTLNLLPAVLVSKAAEDRGCDEAVLIRNGTVTECAHSNVFIVKNGILYTHPNSCLILPGITRSRVLYLCSKLKIKYREEAFTKEELFSADEVLVTSTTKLCVRASEIDGIKLENRDKSVGDAIISSLREDFYNCKS